MCTPTLVKADQKINICLQHTRNHCFSSSLFHSDCYDLTIYVIPPSLDCKHKTAVWVPVFISKSLIYTLPVCCRRSITRAPSRSDKAPANLLEPLAVPVCQIHTGINCLAQLFSLIASDFHDCLQQISKRGHEGLYTTGVAQHPPLFLALSFSISLFIIYFSVCLSCPPLFFRLFYKQHFPSTCSHSLTLYLYSLFLPFCSISLSFSLSLFYPLISSLHLSISFSQPIHGGVQPDVIHLYKGSLWPAGPPTAAKLFLRFTVEPPLLNTDDYQMGFFPLSPPPLPPSLCPPPESQPPPLHSK